MTQPPDDFHRALAEHFRRGPARKKKPTPVTGYMITRRDRSVAWSLRRGYTLADAVAEARGRLAGPATADAAPVDLVVWKGDEAQAVVRLRCGVTDVRYLADPVTVAGDAP